MNWKFKPDVQPENALKVPCFEDARADYAPNYRSRKNMAQAMADVSAELGKLSAGVMEFQRGLFDVNGQERHGYIIKFTQGGIVGVIRVAGLPMASYTANKETQVRVQALLTVADWLKAAVTAKVFNPDMQPLLPFLLMPDGKTTVAEYITSGALMLPDKTGGKSNE